jgi:hypothetical protein
MNPAIEELPKGLAGMSTTALPLETSVSPSVQHASEALNTGINLNHKSVRLSTPDHLFVSDKQTMKSKDIVQELLSPSSTHSSQPSHIDLEDNSALHHHHYHHHHHQEAGGHQNSNLEVLLQGHMNGASAKMQNLELQLQQQLQNNPNGIDTDHAEKAEESFYESPLTHTLSQVDLTSSSAMVDTTVNSFKHSNMVAQVAQDASVATMKKLADSNLDISDISYHTLPGTSTQDMDISNASITVDQQTNMDIDDVENGDARDGHNDDDDDDDDVVLGVIVNKLAGSKQNSTQEDQDVNGMCGIFSVLLVSSTSEYFLERSELLSLC